MGIQELCYLVILYQIDRLGLVIGLGLCLQHESRAELIGPMLFSSFLFVFFFINFL